MKTQVIDLDLDYFNYFQRKPIGPKVWGRSNRHPNGVIPAVKLFLATLPRDVPCHFVVEHHHVLDCLPKGKTRRPIDRIGTWFHVDEHHDFYADPSEVKSGIDPDCGNYCWAVPTTMYKRFIWVTPPWSKMKNVHHGNRVQIRSWMKRHQRTFEVQSKWTWQKSRVGLVLVCLSPDFIYFRAEEVDEVIRMIGDHFNLKKVPVPRDREGRYYSRSSVSSWSLARRIPTIRPLRKSEKKKAVKKKAAKTRR